MKIMVGVKRVVDFNVRVRVLPDGSGVDLTGVKMSMNPFDEIALEEAIRLREKGDAGEIIAVSVGPDAVQDTLRMALALGADRGIHVRAAGRVEPLGVAKLLAALARREQPGLALLGKQAIDDDSNQTGQMLAALLGWGQGTFASAVTVAGEAIEVRREVDGGIETLALPLPAVITADLRLNTPRFATLPHIMKAKKKPIEQVTPAELGVDVAPRLVVVRTDPPAPRQGGQMVGSVDELVDRLRNHARVI